MFTRGNCDAHPPGAVHHFGGQGAAGQVRALAQPGQPIAAAARPERSRPRGVGERVGGGQDDLDVGELHLEVDALARGVLGGVGDRLLRCPVQRQRGVRLQPAGLPMIRTVTGAAVSSSPWSRMATSVVSSSGSGTLSSRSAWTAHRVSGSPSRVNPLARFNDLTHILPGPHSTVPSSCRRPAPVATAA
ncbi:hypothetical protein [Streptantibioticus ferralitis]|uniref:Uncharacterized protein n=1 Tax=Streptantibioticus ferralitis TaxID=236510 RepID=A0ABT5Z8V1_9ACTN|nr:hypothetical protein [Streptantibioticus ferralitis]MDF2260258.1 hypothetical protein [Streptantibioticus ferralitis]